MSKIKPYVVQDESGTEYTVYIQADDDGVVEDVTRGGDIWEDGDESYRDNRPRSTVPEKTFVRMREISGTISTYAKFVINAFTNMGGAEVEELNFKFGLKFSGDMSVPVLVKGSAESNFEVEVKCKFPKS